MKSIKDILQDKEFTPYHPHEKPVLTDEQCEQIKNFAYKIKQQGEMEKWLKQIKLENKFVQ